MADYDISKAFETIENELIDSMMRNFKHHRAEEEKEGYNWSQWQSEQLKSSLFFVQLQLMIQVTVAV